MRFSNINELVLKGPKIQYKGFKVYYDRKTITLENSKTFLFIYFLDYFFYSLIHLELNNILNIFSIFIDFFVSNFMLFYSEYSFDYSYIFNNVKYEERGVDIYDLAKSIINNRIEVDNFLYTLVKLESIDYS